MKNVKKSRHKYLNLKLWFLFCNLRKITYASHVHRMKTCHRCTWVKDEETANARNPPTIQLQNYIYLREKNTTYIKMDSLISLEFLKNVNVSLAKPIFEMLIYLFVVFAKLNEMLM